MNPKIDYEAFKASLEKEGAKPSVIGSILALTQELDSKRWILKALLASYPDSFELIEL